MTPLSPDEEAALRELEADLAKPEEPLTGTVRVERFIAEPVGMSDDGELFPVPPDEP